MSRDQRPGKVRVFSSSQAAAPPARRRGDVGVARSPLATSASPMEALAAPAPVAPANGILLHIVLFMLGCAVGGALLAWSGWMPGSGS